MVRRGIHFVVMPATQLLINTTWFSLSRDIGTPSRSTGTLEPRDIGTPSAQGGERAPTREPANVTDPRNGIFQVSPRASSAVSPLRVSLPSSSWRLRRPGWCTLVAGTVFGLSFPESLKERRVTIIVGRELFKTVCTGSQCARVAGGR